MPYYYTEAATQPWMIAFVILIGLCLGSFATACAWRIPRKRNFISDRSRCTQCNTPLGVKDLFPVLSWLWLRGKCRHRGVKFSVSYVLAELATAALVTFVYLRLGFTLPAFILMLLAVAIVIMSIIDFELYIIPDGLNLTIFILAIAYQLSLGAPLERFIFGPLGGIALAYGLRQLMWVWKKQEGLGLGDVKLAASLGLFLPIETITTFLFLAGMIGILTAIVWKLLKKGERFPFGPALGLALFICITLPELTTFWQGAITALLIKH